MASSDFDLAYTMAAAHTVAAVGPFHPSLCQVYSEHTKSFAASAGGLAGILLGGCGAGTKPPCTESKSCKVEQSKYCNSDPHSDELVESWWLDSIPGGGSCEHQHVCEKPANCGGSSGGGGGSGLQMPVLNTLDG